MASKSLPQPEALSPLAVQEAQYHSCCCGWSLSTQHPQSDPLYCVPSIWNQEQSWFKTLTLLAVTNPMHTVASSLSSNWKLHSCLPLILNLERRLTTRNFIMVDCMERASAGTPSLCKLLHFLVSWLYFVPSAHGKPSPHAIPKLQVTYCCVHRVSNRAHKLVRFTI